MEGVSALRQPEEVRLSGYVPKNWRGFKQRFAFYLEDSRLDGASYKQKLGLFITNAGPEALGLYSTFIFMADDLKSKYASTIKMFDDHCTLKHNESYEINILDKGAECW